MSSSKQAITIIPNIFLLIYCIAANPGTDTDLWTILFWLAVALLVAVFITGWVTVSLYGRK